MVSLKYFQLALILFDLFKLHILQFLQFNS